MCATVGVVIEFPEMYKLIDRACVALEIPDKLLILPALLERREADLLIELHRLCHLDFPALVTSCSIRKGALAVKFLPIASSRVRSKDTYQPHEIGIFVRSTGSLTFREKYRFLTLHPVRLLV
jgi:hypothetical protein